MHITERGAGLRRYSRGEQGFTLIEILVALAVAILAIGIPVLVLSATGHGFARQAMTITSTHSVDSVLDQMQQSAHTSIAIYTPSSCGTGQPHGDTLACSSVRFYGKDASGTAHFWGYEYSGTTLKQCLSYATASPDGACTKYGATLQNITAFSAVPEPVSVIASTLGVSAPASKEYEMYSAIADPNGRIVAGNRVMIVSVSNSAVNRQIHLLQGGAPFTTAVLRGVFTAPRPGTFGSATNFVFTTPTDPAQAGTASESSYSNFQLPQYAAWYWQISSCTSGGTTIATISYNATQSGDTLNYTVTPANVGTCTITLSTRDQWFTETIQVYAAPIYSLAIPSGPSPNYVTPSGTSTFVVTDTLSNSGAVRPGYWPSTQSVSAVSNSPSICGVGPSGAQASGTTFTISYVAVGTCSITASGVSAGSQTFTIGSYQAANYVVAASAASPSTVSVGGSATFTATATLSNAGNAPPGSPSTIQVAVSAISGPCGTSPGTGTWQNSGSTFSITTSGSGTCTINVVGNVPAGATSNGAVTTTLTVTSYNNAVYSLSHTMPSNFSVGSSSTFTASDTQTANNTSPGTPSTVAVQATASGCTVSPSGWQASGTTFTLTASSAGTCTVTISDNYGSVSGATSNSPQSLSVSVNSPTGCTRSGSTVTFLGGTCTITGSISLSANCGTTYYPDGNWDYDCYGDESDSILGDLGYQWNDGEDCEPYPGWGTEGMPQTCTPLTPQYDWAFGNALVIKFANSNFPTTYANRLTVTVAWSNYVCTGNDPTCGEAPEIVDYDNYQAEYNCGPCGNATLSAQIRPLALYGYSTAFSANDISNNQLYMTWLLQNDFQNEGCCTTPMPNGSMTQSANYTITITQGSGAGGITETGGVQFVSNPATKCMQWSAGGYYVYDGWPVCKGM